MATFENPYFDDSDTDWMIIARGEIITALLNNDTVQFFTGAQLYDLLSQAVKDNLPLDTLEQIAASLGVIKVSD